MRSIAIINQKGGVGKTTTAVNLSAGLAESGRRVCLVDLDPQAHASLHLGATLAPDECSIYDCLTSGAPLRDARREITDQLHLIPSHIDLAAAEMELATEVGRESIFRDALESDDAEYDYLILDCPPSLGVLTLNALTAVQEVLLPLQPHFLALHGLSKLLRTIDIVGRRLNPGLQLTGVVLCMYDSGTRLADEVSADVHEFFTSQPEHINGAWTNARSFATRIRRNIRLAEAPSHGQTIFQYAADSNGAEDYRALTKEMISTEQSSRVGAAA